MRTYQIALPCVWGVAACGGSVQPIPPDPTSLSQDIGTYFPTYPDAGNLVVSSGSSSSGADQGGSGSSSSGADSILEASVAISGDAGGSGGSVVPSSGQADPPTCVGAATQACGNCNSGQQERSCVNGSWSAWGNCVNATTPDLSSVGTGDFTISFQLTDTDTLSQAVVNQRRECQDSTTSYWDIWFNAPTCLPGALSVQTYDPTTNGGLTVYCAGGSNTAPYYPSVSGHQITIHRVSGRIVVMVDDFQSDSWADTTNLGSMAPVAAGMDVCDSPGTMVPLDGSLNNLCVEKQ